MKALTFQGKQKIRYQDVDDPRIESPRDAIVKVSLTAVCGSDMHVYLEREKGLDRGTVMGHEFVGEVVEAGSGVGGVKVGDLVASPFTTSCGECFFCQSGLPGRCTSGQLFGWVQNGAGLHGGQAEYVRVPLADSTLVPLPEGVLKEEGLLLGDVFSTGWYCADMAETGPGGVYAVVGCGPVGLMAVVGAKDRGAGKIFAIDSIQYRLEIAARFGAVPIDFSKEDPAGIILDATDGRGADAVLEAVGSADAGRSAYQLVRPGGIIAVAGVHTEEHFVFSPAEAYDKNLTYRVGRCPARRYMEQLMPVLQEKKYDITAIISHRMRLEDGAEAYAKFDKRLEDCVKIVLEP